jgi:hypothetical protein
MRHVELGPVSYAPGLDITFPAEPCANCGTRQDLSTLDQDTKKTNYFILGGTELTFQFPVASCADCAKSLRRRPKSLFANALLSIVVGFVSFAVLLLAIEMSGVEISVLRGDNLGKAAMAITVLAFVALPFMQRPGENQTSYFQPVRVVGLKRRFLDGRIERIKFQFTNADYQQAFATLNADAVTNGVVEIKS